MYEIYGYKLTDADKNRFWSKVSIRGENECWEWSGSLHKLGYGHFRIGGKYGKIVPSHRVAKMFSCDDFDQSKHCLHRCDNRACCNPSHIWLGTHAENMKDAVSKGRNKTARAGNGYTKIPKEKYLDIFNMHKSGLNKSKIARHFGVTPTNIRFILKGITNG